MGLYTRFEYGGRKDAIIRSAKYQDLIAMEWEREGVWGNELDKLQKHSASNKETLLYCVLITYTHTPNIQKVYDYVLENSRKSHARYC